MLTNKLISVLGDNANTLQGEFGGVIVKFKHKLPYLKEGRCIAHINNLIVKNFVEKIPEIEKFKKFIYKMVQYFAASPQKKPLL